MLMINLEPFQVEIIWNMIVQLEILRVQVSRLKYMLKLISMKEGNRRLIGHLHLQLVSKQLTSQVLLGTMLQLLKELQAIQLVLDMSGNQEQPWQV